jgi:predicted nucleic acid-binding protein
VLIDVQRGHAPAVAWFASLTNLPSVPGLVVMELVQDARNAQQVHQALRLISPLPVVWPTEADCNRALSDFAAYHLSHNLGLLDALIAACAVGLSTPPMHFQHKALPRSPRADDSATIRAIIADATNGSPV